MSEVLEETNDKEAVKWMSEVLQETKNRETKSDYW
jgi:hypothetical protein